ncbi:MAG: MFS transporter, partial [Cyclobacteriaceae bacterium]
IIFLGVFYLGKFSISPTAQAYLFAISCAFPLAALGILPYAILAEIAEADGLATGQQKEGMYFGVRNFFDKVGQTLGIMLFAILTLYGKDPGHDWGIRLNGIFGFVLCFLAAIAFFWFKEKRANLPTLQS